MIDISASATTPRIVYRSDSHVLIIEGESYPENSFTFYAPVFTWLKTELPRLDVLSLELDIPYMNSSSTKCVLDILDMLEERSESGGEISIVWRYEAGNDRSLELAEEFKEDVEIPFEIIPRENKAV